MEKFSKRERSILWCELLFSLAIVIVPILAYLGFIYNHNILVLSTESWLLFVFAYQSLLLLTLPNIYSLTLELFIIRLSNNEKSPSQHSDTTIISREK